MRKLYTLLNIFLICSISWVQAQSSLNTSGTTISSNTGSISYSVGQVFYNTMESNAGSVMQGVQQAIEIYRLDTNDLDNLRLSISTYPNPTKELLYINVQEENITDFSFIIYTLNGKIIQELSLKNKITPIDLSNLPSSVYILKVLNNSKQVRSFKIIKK